MLSDEERLTVVNVVASTRVAEELDLPDIAIQLNCEYEPEQFPGVVYRVVDPKLAILMFRSGRAVCTGGKNQNNIEVGIEMMTRDLQAAGIETGPLDKVEIEVQNMVATYSLFYPEDYDGVARMDDNNTRVIDTPDGIRAATDEEVADEDSRIRGIREGEPLAALPRKLNLNNLTFHLPFDKVEYEPEQFPGLRYRLDYPRVVCLIFGSGKLVFNHAENRSLRLIAHQGRKHANRVPAATAARIILRIG